VKVDFKIDPNSGTLGIIEFSQLRFSPARLYWVTDLIPGSIRGNHAHKTLIQAMFVIHGSFNLKLYNGEDETLHRMLPNGHMLYVQPGIWREFWTDEPGSILCVLCDQPFDESDYIRDFNEYIEWFRAQK
jgi:dTDP-4-dehydrorhamnose 3,5-epimerase-like enzyme